MHLLFNYILFWPKSLYTQWWKAKYLSKAYPIEKQLYALTLKNFTFSCFPFSLKALVSSVRLVPGFGLEREADGRQVQSWEFGLPSESPRLSRGLELACTVGGRGWWAWQGLRRGLWVLWLCGCFRQRAPPSWVAIKPAIKVQMQAWILDQEKEAVFQVSRATLGRWGSFLLVAAAAS